MSVDADGLPRHVRWPEGLVAFWDFRERIAPFASAGPGRVADLVDGAGSRVTSREGGPFGRSLMFNGESDYLVITADRVADLNLSTHGDECSVVAWVSIDEASIERTKFVAGMWQEDPADPRRQYGLFIHLPLYGGAQQVCGHVSATGGATPGYPYAREYSASRRVVEPGWSMIGFTYDGVKIVSYLDGYADERDDYQDPLGNRYSKNPYGFPDGLNRRTVSDFTVGAVDLGAPTGVTHHFHGLMGGLAVFKRCLPPGEMASLFDSTLDIDSGHN